jgi:hypothetical protein
MILFFIFSFTTHTVYYNPQIIISPHRTLQTNETFSQLSLKHLPFKSSAFVSSTMAAAILVFGALLTHSLFEKRKSHKAAKQSDYDFKQMQTENAKLYSQRSPSSVYSQTTLQGVADSNAPMSMDGPPSYEKLVEGMGATKSSY